MSVQVRRLDGGIAYARTFSVADNGEDARAGTAGQVRRNLGSALGKVVAQLMSDRAFLDAQSAAPPLT